MTSTSAKIAVVVNGNAKSVNEKVISKLRASLTGGDLFVSRHIDEAPEIAEKIVERGYDALLTGGGDGTFTVMVSQIVKIAERRGVQLPRFGLLRLGTGNAMASVIGACPLPRGDDRLDVERAVLEAKSCELHLVDVDGQLTPFAGLGADAQILADYNRSKSLFSGTPLAYFGRGLSGYAFAALSRSLPSMIFQKLPQVKVINEGEEAWPIDESGIRRDLPIRKGEVLYEGKSRVTAASAIPYYGFGLKLFPFAELCQGGVNLRISRLGPPQVLTHLRGIWNGSYYDSRYYSDFFVKSVRIECSPSTEFQIGGDSYGLQKSVSLAASKISIQLIDFS